jgi:hypothetical protein
VAFVYAVPVRFAGGANRILRPALGGWAVTGYLSLESGLPLSISQANGRPIVIGNPRVSGAIDV